MSLETKSKPNITPAPDGPYLVRDLENLTNRKGPLDTKPTMALCRCGGSANKPFCDGTHAKIGFCVAALVDATGDRYTDLPLQDHLPVVAAI